MKPSTAILIVGFVALAFYAQKVFRAKNALSAEQDLRDIGYFSR